jgi:hypothetical protein
VAPWTRIRRADINDPRCWIAERRRPMAGSDARIPGRQWRLRSRQPGTLPLLRRPPPVSVSVRRPPGLARSGFAVLIDSGVVGSTPGPRWVSPNVICSPGGTASIHIHPMPEFRVAQQPLPPRSNPPPAQPRPRGRFDPEPNKY